MQRPTRIVVFGVLCLLVGGVSGLKNVTEVGVTLLGPSFMDQMVEMQSAQGMSETYLESSRAQVNALRKPMYRAGQGIESALTASMAALLIVAGVGLLRDRMWAIRLTRWWGYYALCSAVATVVLEVRFVLPETTSLPAGMGLASAACMLPFLWLFPVLLLTMLPRPIVLDYLRWRASSNQVSLPAAAVHQPPMESRGSSTQAGPPPAATQRPAPPPGDQTWRDDPWNDPSSR